MPALRKKSCGRWRSDRTSDPTRTSRLKLSTSPAITDTGRTRLARVPGPGGPALAGGPASAGGLAPAGGAALPGGGVATDGGPLPYGLALAGGLLPAGEGPASAGEDRASSAGAAPATSTTGRTGRMQGEMPARKPATMPTSTRSTTPPPFHDRQHPLASPAIPIRHRPASVLVRGRSFS